MPIPNYIIVTFLSFVIIPHVAISKGELRTLNEENWSEMLTGEWMVEFFAPWCPACQQLQPLWKDFAEWSDDLSIKIGGVDVNLNPGLSGRFMITALPTIFHVKDGVFRQYRGARDKDSFISFVEEKKWQSIEPVSSWKSPQSLQMATISAFFKLSMLLRNMHNTIVDDYGIPYWGSYIIFGLITILVGALLGLLVVCVIDYFCPCLSRVSYPGSPKHPAGFDEKKNETEREFEGEDIIKEDTPGEGDIRRRREPTTSQ